METETLDKLYLEISQFTKAKTGNEIRLEIMIDILINKCLLLHQVTCIHELSAEVKHCIDCPVRMCCNRERNFVREK